MKQAGMDTSFLDLADHIPAAISALSLAVERASLAEIELLVKSGADVTWVDDKGYSILLRALFPEAGTTDEARRAVL